MGMSLRGKQTEVKNGSVMVGSAQTRAEAKGLYEMELHSALTIAQLWP